LVSDAAPPVGVLALQGDVIEHLRMLTAAGARAVRVRRAEELAAVAGLVLPGGESTTMAKLARAFEVLEPLRAAVKAELPMYGSCAGMILLADRVLDGTADQETVGGLDITVRRNAFGRQVDSFEREVTLRLEAGARVGRGPALTPEGDEAPFHAVFIRAPWVAQAGSDVSVVAEDNGRIVAVRQGPLLATAFHPELTPDRRIHELFVEMVKGTS
jgi:pyridoxal 5'-phosphate synthase pdxT subunit